MGIFRIIDVPDVAEFYKYWVVEESAAATLVYKDGFLTFEEALKRAFEIKGENATISLIPDGVSVIVR